VRDAPLPEGSTAAEPRRTCVGCRRTRAKHALLRLAATPDGVRADPQRRLPGRGAYVCPSTTCIEAAAHRGGHAVRRALRGAPEHEVREALDTLHRTVTGPAAVAPPQAPKEHNA
jgi:predicted RNA-binding protein YlxR (DUF448 family)